jgi:drug/metabolite transporter (DMT)-like permease
MNIGYVWMLMALTSFGAVGIFCKLSEVKKCRASALNAVSCLWSALLLAGFLTLRHFSFKAPAKVVWLAVPFGIIAAISSIAFLTGIKYGNISTSWLVINLSAAVPAAASVIIYHEMVSSRKVSGLAFAVIALFMLYNDKRVEVTRKPGSEIKQPHDLVRISAGREKLAWASLMAVAFLLNGSGPFGLRILAQMRLTDRYQYQYLLLWFASDFVLAATAFFSRHSTFDLSEIWIGAGIGLFGLTGQLGIAMALSYSVPGYLVFPLAIGGSLFVVVTCGVLVFKEKIGSYGIAGLILGAASIVTLAIP